jgi:hypothetical protein
MEDFTNEQIDIDASPKFEAVLFTALHPKYWTVIVFNCLLFFCWFRAALAAYFTHRINFFLIEISISTSLHSRYAFAKDWYTKKAMF